MARLRYVERSTGEIREERIVWARFLPWLYGRTPVARACRAVLRTRPPSRIYGWLQQAPWSRRQISSLATRLSIDIDESEEPISAYPSLAAFFARRLRPGARTFSPDPAVLCSPADGRVLVFPRLAGGMIPVKGAGFSLATLVQDHALARQYEQGAVAVIRLAPADYHWFHFPDGGVAGRWRVVPGAYDSINHYALARDPEILCHNYRHVTVLASSGFGPLLIVEIGALFVGSIFQRYTPGRVERGAPKGGFGLGASSLVLAALPGRLQLDPDLVANSRAGLETRLPMGASLGRSPAGAGDA